MTYNERADLIKTIRSLERRIESLERRPRAGNTSIDSGAFTLINPNTGNTVFFVGTLSNGDYGIEMYRDDGVLAFRVGRALSTDTSQIARMYNRQGEPVAGDQFLSAYGYSGSQSTPALATSADTLFTTTSATFVNAYVFRFNFTQGYLRAFFGAICSDGTTAGEVRLTDRFGTAISGFFGAVITPKVIPIGTTTETDFTTNPNDANGEPLLQSLVGAEQYVVLQVRRTAGVGTVGIRGWNLQQYTA